MILVMLAVLGWHHPAWGPLLHEISWPVWAMVVTAAILELVETNLRAIKGFIEG